MKELISIIIPVYNVEAYLKECVDSVLNQTYETLEVILVDDGSTDSSGAMCDEYAAVDRRVRVIHKENGGQSAARNVGLNQAKGRWILFVDSDDYIADDIVWKLREAAGDYDMAMCSRQKFVDRPVPTAASGEIEIYDNLSFLKKIYDAPKYIAVWGKLYRRELFGNFQFQEGIIYEDEDALPQLIYAANGIAYLDEELYFYRIRPGSTMNSTFSKKQMDILWVCEHRIELFTQWGLANLRQQAVKDYYHHLLKLERFTKEQGLSEYLATVRKKKRQWKQYGVKFSLIEKLRFKI